MAKKDCANSAPCRCRPPTGSGNKRAADRKGGSRTSRIRKLRCHSTRELRAVLSEPHSPETPVALPRREPWHIPCVYVLAQRRYSRPRLRRLLPAQPGNPRLARRRLPPSRDIPVLPAERKFRVTTRRHPVWIVRFGQSQVRPLGSLAGRAASSREQAQIQRPWLFRSGPACQKISASERRT